MKAFRQPSEVDVAQIYGSLGCHENEVAASQIIKWLAKHGDEWFTPFNAETVLTARHLDFHRHEAMNEDDEDHLCNIESYLTYQVPGEGMCRVTTPFRDNILAAFLRNRRRG
jgi:hypothetical protein